MRKRFLPAAAGVPRQRLEFGYDSVGRRYEKRVYWWDGNHYELASTRRYVYDDWNLIAEMDETGTIRQRYTWGLDLSGSLQGAGGVGGLLAVHDATTGLSAAPFYDANGNVMGYADLATGDSVAEFEYGPFGEPLRATGPLAQAVPFRFSTKYTDSETRLVYYGYRYYDAATGRWLSRDPLGEEGGINLYGFVGNDPNGYVDYLGQDPINTKTSSNPVLDPNPGNGSNWRNPNTGQYSKPGTVPGVKLPDPKPKPKGSKHAGPDAIAGALANLLLSADGQRFVREARQQCQKQSPYSRKSVVKGCKCCVITVYYTQNNYSGYLDPVGSVGTIFKGSCSSARKVWRSSGPTIKPSFTKKSLLQLEFTDYVPW